VHLHHRFTSPQPIHTLDIYEDIKGHGYESWNHSDHCFGAHVDRRNSHMAAQQELGLLSQWWIGYRSSCRSGAFLDRALVTEGRELAHEAQRRWLRVKMLYLTFP